MPATTQSVLIQKGSVGDPDNLAAGIQFYARIDDRKVIWFQSAESRDSFIARLALRLAIEEGKDVKIIFG